MKGDTITKCKFVQIQLIQNYLQFFFCVWDQYPI